MTPQNSWDYAHLFTSSAAAASHMGMYATGLREEGTNNISEFPDPTARTWVLGSLESTFLNDR